MVIFEGDDLDAFEANIAFLRYAIAQHPEIGRAHHELHETYSTHIDPQKFRIFFLRICNYLQGIGRWDLYSIVLQSMNGVTALLRKAEDMELRRMKAEDKIAGDETAEDHMPECCMSKEHTAEDKTIAIEKTEDLEAMPSAESVSSLADRHVEDISRDTVNDIKAGKLLDGLPGRAARSVIERMEDSRRTRDQFGGLVKMRVKVNVLEEFDTRVRELVITTIMEEAYRELDADSGTWWSNSG